MAGPQLPQDKLNAELDEIDESITNLQVLYEKYFLGIDRRPPAQERKRVSGLMRELRTRLVRNTAQKFRINTLFAKLISFERMWDRTLREMEEGTYKRDVFKARMRQGDEGPKKQVAAPAASPAISDDKLRRIYDTFVVARQRTGEATDNLSYDALAKRIRAQVPELMQKHKARNIEFKVVIKGGKAILKAVPHS